MSDNLRFVLNCCCAWLVAMALDVMTTAGMPFVVCAWWAVMGLMGFIGILIFNYTPGDDDDDLDGKSMP